MRILTHFYCWLSGVCYYYDGIDYDGIDRLYLNIYFFFREMDILLPMK